MQEGRHKHYGKGKGKMEQVLDSAIYAFQWYIFPTAFLSWLVLYVVNRI